MDLSVFKSSLSGSEPTTGISIYLKAMWYDAKGKWDKAHRLIQDLDDVTAAWVHAYLHRREQDLVNADYWYRRAGKQRPAVSLEKEWDQIVATLL